VGGRNHRRQEQEAVHGLTPASTKRRCAGRGCPASKRTIPPMVLSVPIFTPISFVIHGLCCHHSRAPYLERETFFFITLCRLHGVCRIEELASRLAFQKVRPSGRRYRL
jgi:hypothetical protein